MSSFKENVDQIVEDMKGRVRNPLILSFIFVWLYQNWNILFIYFNLSSSFTFGEKLLVLRTYLNLLGAVGIILDPLFFAFISLSIYFVIGVAAQFIKLWLGKRLGAAMLAKFDKGKYEEKKVVEKIRTEKDNLKIEKETIESEFESNKSKLKQKDAELEETKLNQSKTLADRDTKIGTLNADVQTLNQEKAKLVESFGELNRKLENLNEANKNLLQDLKDVKDLRIADADLITDLSERAAISTRIKTNPEDIFSVGSWRMTWSKNGINYEEFFHMIFEDEKYYFKTTSDKILITSFLFDGDNNTVSFKKTNLNRGYADLQTVLIINDYNRLTGVEGNKLLVEYTRLAKANPAVK